MLELVLPSDKFIESVRKGIAEYKNSPSPFDIHCVEKLINAEKDNFISYFTAAESSRKGIGLKKGYVPATTLWLINDGKYIGSFDIRHKLNDFLYQSGGHIAYQIVPSERNKGYAKAGLKLALAYARNVLKIKQALLTCRFENQASYKTMLSVMKEWGGREDTPSETDGQKEHRVWIDTAFATK